MTVQFLLNGEKKELPKGSSLQTLVDDLKMTGQAMAIAVNRQVITRQKWSEYQLKDNDQVDVVRAIGGG